MSKGGWWALGVMVGCLVAPTCALLAQVFLDRSVLYPDKET